MWLVDPLRRTLEAYELATAGPGQFIRGHWRLVVEASRKDSVRVPPFAELNLELGDLWV